MIMNLKSLMFCIAFAVFFVSPLVAQDGNTLIERANTLYQQGRFAQAMLIYRKAEQRAGDPVAIAFNIGNCYFRLDRYPEAAAAYRKAVHLSKEEFTPALFNLAAVLFRLNEYAASVAAYRRALRSDPENTAAWLYLAEAYNRSGDPVGAQRALENARRLDTEDVSIVYQLAEVFVALGEHAVAVALVREAYASNPTESDFLIYIGDVYRLVGDMENAAAAYREAMGVQTENTDLQYKLADVLAEAGKPFLAMDILQRTLSLRPDFSDAAIFLGNLAYDAKWWDRAERAYLQAGLAGNTEAAQGLRNIALEFEEMGQTAQAIGLMEKAVAIDPQDAVMALELRQLRETL